MTDFFDLNLIRLLVAIADAGSVSEAARELGMSQSGLSTALTRARKLLNDDLFIRTADGVRPTARATRVIDAARSVLKTVREGILELPAFDPATWAGQFRFAMQDVSEAVFLPELLARLQRAAPGVSLHCVDFDGRNLQEALADGSVDLAMGYYPGLDTKSVARQTLYQHTYACLVRRGHPVLVSGLDLQAYRDLGHVLVTTTAAAVGRLRKVLSARRINRRVVVELPHILSIPAVVERSDLIATVPLAVAEYFTRYGKLIALPVPFPPMWIEVQQYWHRAFHRDARIGWLRDQITTLFNDQSDRWRALEESLYGKGKRRHA